MATDELVRFKLASAMLTFAIGALGVGLPWLIRRGLTRAAARTLSLGNMLSVGVMLGGGLLHLLPDAAEGAGERRRLQEDEEEGYPFAFLSFSLGLLLPLCVEQLLHGGHGSPAHLHTNLLSSGGSSRRHTPITDTGEGSGLEGSPASSEDLHVEDEVAQLSKLPFVSVRRANSRAPSYPRLAAPRWRRLYCC